MHEMFLSRMLGKKDTFCASVSRDDQISTSAKLIDIKYEFYGFVGDLIETITKAG